jgi:hypothetical protein
MCLEHENKFFLCSSSTLPWQQYSKKLNKILFQAYVYGMSEGVKEQNKGKPTNWDVYSLYRNIFTPFNDNILLYMYDLFGKA